EGLRESLGVPPGATVFLYCGKLYHVKRPIDLLEAYARLACPDRDYLLYVGDGPQRAEIEARARALRLRNVRITGFRNQSELPDYYGVADVVVLPSGSDTWGLVVNEG